MHDTGCGLAGYGMAHSDAAQACADAVNLHRTAIGADAIGRVVAVRLADGTSDGTLYDSRSDAIRHQLHEQMCAYVHVAPGGMTVCQAESYMAFVRSSYDAGMRLVDPDHAAGGRQVIPALTQRGARRQLSALSTLRPR